MDGKMTLSGRLARFVEETRFEALPRSVQEEARGRLLDGLGPALAARGLPVPGVALAFASGHEGPATVIGHPHRLPLVDAAFVNAALVNGRSQDDFLLKSHPSALTIPAGLGLAEAEDRSGAELLAGLVVGYEVMGRIFMAGPRMLPRFRGSGVAGTVGAAATAAKLARLDIDQTMHALGLGAMFAHGFGQGFVAGTQDVKLNVAMAARSGVTAALLSRCGATAAPDAFEGESGFLRAFDGSVEHAESALEGLGEHYLIEDTVYKECPVCIFTQTPIALARTLADKLKADRVQRVVVSAPGPTYTNPGFHNVAPYGTHLQAVVSARFCTAAALLGKPVEAHDFWDRTSDPDVLALAARIELVRRDDPGRRVDVEVIQDGTTFMATGVENDTLHPTTEKVVAKFLRMTRELPVDGEAIVETVMGLDTLPDVRRLAQLLRRPD